jgi:protein AroM
LHRLTIITAGQSPRTSMVEELTSHMGVSGEIVQIGALDNLTEMEILGLKPQGEELGLATVLKSGKQVTLSESWLRQRITEICGDRGRTADDLTVVASTGVFDWGTTGEFVLHAQNILDEFMDAMLLSGFQTGKLVPLVGQLGARGKKQARVSEVYGPMGNPPALKQACDRLGECDILVMNSMGYTEQERAVVQEYLGKPTVHVRQLIGQALSRTIRQSKSKSAGERLLEGSALNSRLGDLTKRERQVFDHVLKGLANKEIARILEISHRTVEIHRSRMLAKMGVSSSTELMRLIVHNASRGRR